MGLCMEPCTSEGEARAESFRIGCTIASDVLMHHPTYWTLLLPTINEHEASVCSVLAHRTTKPVLPLATIMEALKLE